MCMIEILLGSEVVVRNVLIVDSSDSVRALSNDGFWRVGENIRRAVLVLYIHRLFPMMVILLCSRFKGMFRSTENIIFLLW